MPLAGPGYPDWAVILPRVLAAADATGEEVESWPDPPADPTPHAGRVEGPGGTLRMSPNPRYAADGLRLRLRCAVDVPARAKVRIVASGKVYPVTGSWQERDGRRWQTVVSLDEQG